MIKITSHHIILASFIFASSFMSCSEGSFTKVVDLDLEEVENQLAVIARMNTDEDVNLILVSETVSVLDTSQFRSLDNAKVVLKTPDQGDIQLDFDPTLNLFSIENYQFKEGQEYSLEVDHPAHTSMKADVKVPTAPDLIDIDISLPDSIGQGQFAPDVISITFRDPANEENSYVFRGRKKYQLQDSGEEFISEYYFDLSNNILEFNDDIITDLTFDGKEYELIILGYPSASTTEPLTLISAEIEIVSLSSDFLLYDRSVEQAYDAEDNPFVEPSTIFTNFDNGFGIFSVDVVKTYKFDF